MVFDPFGDFEENGYLGNRYKLKNKDAIKSLEHNFFDANLSSALSFLNSRKELDYEALLEVHKIIFSDLYPWAGKDRQEVLPEKTVKKGSVVFANPEEIKNVVDHALTCSSLGEVLGGLAYAHPFLDGNGRAISIFFSEHQKRLGRLVRWDKMNKREYLDGLTCAIHGDPSSLTRLLLKNSSKLFFRKVGSDQLSDTLMLINWSSRRAVDEDEKEGGFFKSISRSFGGISKRKP